MRNKYSSTMRSYRALVRLLMLSLLLGLTWSCTETPVLPPGVTYYVTQEITYLLEKPGYNSNILGPLYKGDKVERVGSERDWWQVTLLRSGQTGWIRKELLSSIPIPNSFYYVKTDSQTLRECPSKDCLAIQKLFRGERVQKIEEGSQGWWRVLALESRSLGWVPADTLTERIEKAQQQQPGKSYYYVAVTKLGLRAKPSEQDGVVRTLQFNDQVEKIGETKGWFKVRQPSSGAAGWVRSNALESLPAVYPRGQRPVQKKPKPFKEREEPEEEPKFM